MSNKVMVKGVLFAVCVLVAAQMLPAPAWGQGGYTDIYVLGRPGSTFSPHSPKDLEELKDLFDRFEADLRVVLEKGGWGGDPDDFFRTIRSAQQGDGTVTPRKIQPGESLQWMAHRKNGQPDVIRNPRWSAKKPMDAWQIKVESKGTEYIFVVPVTCMNLAFDSSRQMETASCNINATYDKSADLVTVTASSNGTLEPTGVGIPGGSGSLGDLKKVGDNKWTFQPMQDGTYNFSAKASFKGQETTCQGSVRVERAKPVCDIDTSIDPETNMISIDASATKGDFTLDSYTLPDGTQGDMSALKAGTAGMWTYDPAGTLKRKPGNYTYTFAGTSKLYGAESQCEATAIIVREAPDFRWIARAYYMHMWPGSDDFHTEDPVGVEPPIFTQFWVDGGNGFGGEVEYLFRPNLGIWAGVAFTNMKTSLMFDQADVWLWSDDRVDLRHYSLGGNYHFTPDRRADIFAGVFLSWINYSSSTFYFEEVDRSYRLEYDNELSWGLNAGVDVPIKEGSPWIITGGLRYLWQALESNNGPYHLTIDPLEGFIGFGYRW